MNKRRAILRADASPEIGTGHVVRSITLGRALSDRGWDVVLATEDPPAGLRKMAVEGGLDVVGPDYAEATADEPATLMVVDDYRIDAAWMTSHQSRAALWMAIDDLADRPLPVDIVLDQNLGRRAGDYRHLVRPDTQVLIGPTFALVRPEFARRRATLPPRDGRVRRILVFIGGADHPNVTRRAVTALDGIGFEVEVVVGGSYRPRSEVQALVEGSPSASLHVDTPAMDTSMARADLSIGAPSSASWERCTLGLPSILVAIAENQRMVERALVDAGAAITVGWHAEVRSEDIRAAVLDLADDPEVVRRMAVAAADVADGLGTDRVVTTIESMVDADRENT